MNKSKAVVGLRSGMNAFAKAVIISLAVLVATALLSLQVLRVQGPLYERIVLGKDLIADVLPPPAYVLEAYLETTLILNDPGKADLRFKRLEQLETDYRARHDFWANAPLDAELKQMILVGSHNPAEQFWTEVDQRFEPAVRAGDLVAARASYAKITAAYNEHRAAVDRLVVASNRSNTETERLAVLALGVFVGLVLIVAVALVLLVRRRAAGITRDVVDPLGDITAAMATLSAGGDLDEIPHIDRSDEVGEMARALEVFKAQAAESMRMRDERDRSRLQDEEARRRAAEEQSEIVDSLAGALSNLAKGDLTARIDRAFPGEYDRLREDFNSAAAQLDSALTLVRTTTDGIHRRVTQIARVNGDLTRRTEVQAVNVEETSVSLRDIAQAVREAARSTAQATDAVMAARADAERSEDVIGQTMTAMNQIVQSTHEITQVVEVIDGIAFQTNLLALNAGVEAARAGEFGRGFAVVATEVRALAQHSAEHAKAINQLIQSSTGQVDVGMRSVQDTGETLRRIVTQVGELATFVASLAESTQEQAGRLGAVNVAADLLETSTQQNARMAEENSESVMQLQLQTQRLGEMVDGFRLTNVGSDQGKGEGEGDEDTPAAAIDDGISARHAHVLIVDDNQVNRIVAAKMVEILGFTHEEASDGESAVRAASSGRFDVILMDIMMPGMDGNAAIRAIHRQSGSSGITPVVAITANALEANVAETLKAGAVAVVEKPLSPKALLKAIQSATAGKAAGTMSFRQQA